MTKEENKLNADAYKWVRKWHPSVSGFEQNRLVGAYKAGLTKVLDQQDKDVDELRKEFGKRFSKGEDNHDLLMALIWKWMEPYINPPVKDEWISTGERMPENNQKVLFISSHPDIRYGSFLSIDEWGRENMFCDGAFHFAFSVKFWHPTPNLPAKQ